MAKQRLHVRTSKYGIRFYAGGRRIGLKVKNRNSFLQAGFGRYGPYAAMGVRHKGTFAGGSVGTLGKKVWVGHYGNKFSGSINHNLSSGRTGGRLRVKKLKFRF
ncbi:MAG: hypothetical protein HYW24_02280 [Candidatus Aenigmarchaeota archaeon]|nr:hypothetical protein [Candidatus Aenigmarchaeota archaeon]